MLHDCIPISISTHTILQGRALTKGKMRKEKKEDKCYLDHLLVDAKVSVGMEIGDVEISARRTRLVVNPNGVRV